MHAPLPKPSSDLYSRLPTKGGEPRPVAIVADDDPALVQALSARFRQMGFDVFRSPDAMHALLGAHHIRPRLMVVDVHMPGGNGLSVCEMIYSDPGLQGISVIVMSGDAADEVVRRCRALGAEYVRKGPHLWEEIQSAVRRLWPPSSPDDASSTPAPTFADNRPSAPVVEPSAQIYQLPDEPVPVSSPPFPARPKVLTIDDDPDVTYMLKLRLERLGLEVIEAASGMQGYWKAVECRPQVIICDLSMPDGEGGYIYGRLATHPVTKDIPVIILTGLSNPALRRHLLGLGVAAFLAKPVVMQELIDELRKHVVLPVDTVSTESNRS